MTYVTSAHILKAMTQSPSSACCRGASGGSLKQHPCSCSQFCKSEVCVGLAGSLIRVSLGQNQEIGQFRLSSGGSEKAYTAKLIQVVGRIWFFAVLVLTFLSPRWLSARGSSTCTESHMAPPLPEQETLSRQFPFMLWIFLTFCYQLEKTLLFKGLYHSRVISFFHIR